MSFRYALLAAGIAALPFSASAQQVHGVYIGGSLGLNIMQDQSITKLPGTPAQGHLENNVGPGVVISLGYGFGNGIRAELEGSYRVNSISGANGFGPNSTGSGTEQKYGVMGNLFYDFAGLVPHVTPYVGAGLGYIWANERGVRASAANGALAIASDGTTGSFAYQAMVGVAYPIQAVPGLAVTGEYRFMGMAGNRTYHAATTSIAGPAIGDATMTDNYNHSLLIGLRYTFGQTPPPPPPAPVAAPAPAVAPTRTYLVFFDWDSAALQGRARQVIATAAANAGRIKVTRIEVNGYTDSSGRREYNQRLSLRRADAVAAELVSKGVARSEISITGYGQTHQLVPTGPGVREPQNRRVEIILR